MRGQQHCAATRAVGGHQPPNLPARLWVQSSGGLVEKQNLRFGHQRAGDGQSLPLTARQLDYPSVPLLFELHVGQQCLQRPRSLIEAAEKGQHLFYGQPLGQTCLLQGHAHPLAQPDLVVRPIHAQQLHFAASGWKQPLQHLDCGGLARTVGSEQPETFPARNGEVQALHRQHRPRALLSRTSPRLVDLA